MDNSTNCIDSSNERRIVLLEKLQHRAIERQIVKSNIVVDERNLAASTLNDSFSEKNDFKNNIVDSNISCINDHMKQGDDLDLNVIEETKSLRPLFPVLGGHKFEKKKRIKIVPQWVNQATSISTDIAGMQRPILSISGLDESLVKLLIKQNITKFFPVQLEVIPYLLETINNRSTMRPRDVCVSAATGSGKTFCYVLPILHALLTQKRCATAARALIVLPTQDLAHQIYQVFCSFGNHLQPQIKIALMSGQQDFVKEQENILNFVTKTMTCDVLIATPGRLLDHIYFSSRFGFTLNYLQYLVLDEADRLVIDAKTTWYSILQQALINSKTKLNQADFSCVFGKKIRQVDIKYFVPFVDKLENLKLDLGKSKKNIFLDTAFCNTPGPATLGRCMSTSGTVQKILLSASLSQEPERLREFDLFQPIMFNASSVNFADDSKSSTNSKEMNDSNEFTLPPNLREYYLICSKVSLKPLILHHLLKMHKWRRRVLCFCNSAMSAKRLGYLLKFLGWNAGFCTSAVQKRMRLNSVRKFLNGKLNILVCSDLLARGVDMNRIKCVINYDSPPSTRSYLHRVGRTARAGNRGRAITFLTEGVGFEKFQSMMSDVHHFQSIQKLEIGIDDLKLYESDYKVALDQLRTLLQSISAKSDGKNRFRHRKSKISPNNNLAKV